MEITILVIMKITIGTVRGFYSGKMDLLFIKVNLIMMFSSIEIINLMIESYLYNFKK